MNFIHNPNQIALYDHNNKLIAEVTFPSIDQDTVTINHTFVDTSLRGQGIAGKLLCEAAEEIRAQGKLAVPTCSYAVQWFQKHEEYQDILK